MEGSKLNSGFMAFGKEENGQPSPLMNLIYTIEVSCARNRSEKAIRISFYN
jgi:hypothetical protein